MRKFAAFLLIFIIIFGAMPVHASSADDQADWEYAMHRSLDWLKTNITPHPVVGSVGGEWAVLALVRAEKIDISDPWISGWLDNLSNTLADVAALSAVHDIHHPPTVGTFPSELRRWTDFQRVTIALDTLGLDAANFHGHDLTEIFSTYVPADDRHALNRGVNADIYALIALDAGRHDSDRDDFIQSLIDAQRSDGTWSLSRSAATSAFDLDVTAMAIQALAPYYDSSDAAKTAVDLALRWLLAQNPSDAEGTAQIIVALTALGADFADEAAYYTNYLLQWLDPASGAFRRPTPTSPINMMATEQAAYALVAYWRFVNEMTHLYDMSDVGENAVELGGLNAFPNRHPDIGTVEIVLPDASQNGGASLTRAEFAAIITAALGLPSKGNPMTTAHYYGIIVGAADGNLNPGGIVTRQEAAIMMTRAANLAGFDTNLTGIEILNILAKFGDYRTSAAWAQSALAFCYREGILDDAEFYIRPLAAATRAEIIEMTTALLERAQLL